MQVAAGLKKSESTSSVSKREDSDCVGSRPDVMNSLSRDPRRSWWYDDSNPMGTSPRSQQSRSTSKKFEGRAKP